jgi:hypothetical protein
MLVVKRFADLTASVWANGRGATTELVSFAESEALASGTRWRLSVADLDRPGPFSPLTGVWRTFIPVGGDVVLAVDGAVHECPEGLPIEFDGGARTELVALSGPCHAVNLMVDVASSWRPRLTTDPSDETIVAVALRPGEGFARFDLMTEDAGIPSLARIVRPATHRELPLEGDAVRRRALTESQS